MYPTLNWVIDSEKSRDPKPVTLTYFSAFAVIGLGDRLIKFVHRAKAVRFVIRLYYIYISFELLYKFNIARLQILGAEVNPTNQFSIGIQANSGLDITIFSAISGE